MAMKLIFFFYWELRFWGTLVCQLIESEEIIAVMGIFFMLTEVRMVCLLLLGRTWNHMQQVLHIVILHGKTLSSFSMLIDYRLDWSANIPYVF